VKESARERNLVHRVGRHVAGGTRQHWPAGGLSDQAMSVLAVNQELRSAHSALGFHAPSDGETYSAAVEVAKP
jgi:hypothetical protein